MKEARLIKHGHTVPHIERTLAAFAAHARVKAPTATEVAEIKGSLQIFPVVSVQNQDIPYGQLATADDSNKWLVADRAVFRKQFQDVLPILALSVETVLSIRDFLFMLGLKDRFLSEMATAITEAHGDVSLNQKLTDQYRSRCDFIFRFVLRVPHDHCAVGNLTTPQAYARIPAGPETTAREVS